MFVAQTYFDYYGYLCHLWVSDNFCISVLGFVNGELSSKELLQTFPPRAIGNTLSDWTMSKRKGRLKDSGFYYVSP